MVFDTITKVAEATANPVKDKYWNALRLVNVIRGDGFSAEHSSDDHFDDEIDNFSLKSEENLLISCNFCLNLLLLNVTFEILNIWKFLAKVLLSEKLQYL